MNPQLPGPTPPSTNSSNGASPDNAQFRVVRKRNRVPLSCAPCRHRKLKCNRGHPCDNCTKRGDIPSCTYAAANSRKRTGTGAGPNGTPDDMQNRIDRLESLVLSLMTSGGSATTAGAQAVINTARNSSLGDTSHSASASLEQDGENAMEEDQDDDSDVNIVSQGLGVMKVDGGKSMFVSEAHWYAILANIAEVKKFYAEHNDEYKAQVRKVEAFQDDDAPGGVLFFKAPRLNSREEAIALFPPKAQSDVLIGRYFNSYDPSVHIIHGPTFQRQYDAHWRNPQETSVSFIAIMCGMMSLALQSYDRAGDEPSEYIGRTLSMSVMYRRLTAQSIVLADSEYGRSRDTESGIMILLSMTIRLAMRMGYHRDAGPHPNIPPFHAEMRRRVWMMLRQADLLFSFQAGLPPVSRSDCIDTQMPRNLYDDELHEDMPTLPPSRPDSEPTPMSYMSSKSRLASVFGRIIERLGSVTNPPSYDEAMELDKSLKESRASFPPHLRMRPLHDSMNEPANIIMQRFGLELLYLKSQCVLHRRFLSRGRESARYTYSRRTCIDASMDMLTHQAMLHHESQPGGRLHSVKWYISSLTTSDFLLAAMIVCLELHHLAEAERTGRKGSVTSSPMNDFVEERRDEMLSAIRHSMNIWESLRDRSMEAWKASTTLRVMIEKLMSLKATKDGSNGPSQNAVPMGQNVVGRAYPLAHGMATFGNVPMGDDKGAEQAAAMTLGLLSSGGVSPGPGGQYTNGASGTGQSSGQDVKPYPASMAGLLNEPVQEGRTGLTPGYSGGLQGAPDAQSPFSQMFGQAGSVFDGMTQGADIDWGAWDSFIQGPTMDPISMWPNMIPEQSAPAIDPAIESSGPGTLNGIAQAAQAVSNGPKEGQTPGGGQAGGATTFMGAAGPGFQWMSAARGDDN
ncbi:hypothetical protein CAC42_5112 [Sphaceloma murrayae]|uniref:Zn(2)-C6 fungal-type domain-containing protein n=1 Tax=Sphaceloma murrayae TaxID=2082308 RepID=A0A2K1QUM1_9PEZI|nr:hypothetical protein CAC42_5112 [Sphaceloma murrayae]